MRPIDADAARVKLQAARDKAPDGSAEKAAMDTFLYFLDACPTIEAEPVRHGRWEQDYELVQGFEDNSEYPYVACNLCGNKEYGLDLNDYTDYDDLPNYCPNCGAKMDAGGA